MTTISVEIRALIRKKNDNSKIFICGREIHLLQKTMKEILDRIQFYLNHRSYEQILLGAVIFNNTYGYLGQTADAEKLIKLINAQNDEAQ